MGSSQQVVAAVNGISAGPTTVNAGGVSTVVIDADDNLGTLASPSAGNVRVLATTGDFSAAICDSVSLATAGIACDLAAGSVGTAAPVNDQDFTVDDDSADPDAGPTVADPTNANGVDVITVTWNAPATGPASATITAIQGTSSKSIVITVRGSAETVETFALAAAPASGSTCPGTTAQVINATTATAANGGLAAAALCTLVKDSNGTRLPNQPVVYSTTEGTITPLTDTTSGTGNSAVASALAANSTAAEGDTATVTASSGGKTDTVEVKFGGDPVSCSLTPSPATVEVGGSSKVTVALKDSSGGPVPDGIFAAVAQVNPGSGANAAILGSPAAMTAGSGTVDVIAAIQGAIALGATTPVTALGGGIVGASTTVTCATSIMATGTVVTATPTGTGTSTPGGAGTITGDLPPASGGGVALFVFNGGTVQQLVTASGCPAATSSFYVTSGGVFLTYVPGTTITAVNADFLAKFPGGNIPANTPMMGKCA